MGEDLKVSCGIDLAGSRQANQTELRVEDFSQLADGVRMAAAFGSAVIMDAQTHRAVS